MTSPLHLALELEKHGDLQGAVRQLQEAVHADPANGPAWLALCDIALKLKACPLAALAAEHAEQLMPDHLAAQIACGLAFEMTNREEDAVRHLRKAVQIKPDFTEAWSMLGLTQQNLLRLDDAERAFRKVIEMTGDKAGDETVGVHYWNLALLQLLRGDFINGFAWYRARYNPEGGWAKRLKFPQPLWRGEDLSGKKILIAAEQGFGDVLMMARYFPLLKTKGAHVTLLADAALTPYLRGWSGLDAMTNEEPADQGDFDYQAGLFDLPYIFGTTLETIPAAIPYLPLPEADNATRLPDAGKLKIGFVAAGRREHGNDRRRSLPLAAFVPLFDAPNAQFFNLTHHLKPEDAEMLKQHGVTDLAPRIADFKISAQFVNQLDLVITCDTAMAHLAGGMGKKTWLLLPFAPEWRWLTGRDDSPWYPSMRLFRQSMKGDWDEVMARVRQALQNFG